MTSPAEDPDASVLACKGLVYVYPDGTRANDGIDLALRRGELFCLLGPNGAGKTTLIRQLTTQLRPTEGSVRIFGRDPLEDPSAAKCRLGIIPQTAGLFPALSVEQHLLYFGPLKRLTRAQTREQTQRLLDECELRELSDKKARELSGGQQRKLLVALALLGDPEILVLDEPTVGLDPMARRNVWGTIERQRAAGRTILLTTHYMDEAEKLADRIGFIAAGKLGRVGTLQELYAQLGKSVRVTDLDEESGETRGQHYFDTLPDAQAFVREAGLETYSVGRVSLEDIYLRVMGHAIEAEDG